MRSFLALALLALTIGSGVTARAAASDVSYTGPAGWTPAAVPTPTDSSRAFAQWKLSGDVSTVTFIRDGSTAYVDALTSIRKNFSDNHIKPSVDKDVPCRGVSAHVVEFPTGPDGKRIVINRMIVTNGNGIVTITYARSEGTTFDGDVAKSETTFCSGT